MATSTAAMTGAEAMSAMLIVSATFFGLLFIFVILAKLMRSV